MIRHRLFMPRGWVFTRRYYFRGWRVPRFVFNRLGRGKCMSVHLSRLEGLWAKVQVRS